MVIWKYTLQESQWWLPSPLCENVHQMNGSQTNTQGHWPNARCSTIECLADLYWHAHPLLLQERYAQSEQSTEFLRGQRPATADWDTRELEAYLESSPPESPPHKRRAEGAGLPKASVSPIRRSMSPPRRSTSPSRRSASPTRRSLSPSRRSTSPSRWSRDVTDSGEPLQAVHLSENSDLLHKNVGISSHWWPKRVVAYFNILKRRKIIIKNNLCIMLFSGVYKLTALYNILKVVRRKSYGGILH